MPPQKPPSPTWKTFLKHHVQDLASLDFFVVPTLTHNVPFALLILAHKRRRLVHVNITAHPTAAWTAQQVIDAFPWDEAPRYLLRDRDCIDGAAFRQRVRHSGNRTRRDRPAESVAEPLRRTADREYPPRMPGPCDCPPRATSQAALDRVLPVLPPLAHAPGVGYGLSCAAAGSTAGAWTDLGSPTSGWVASSL